MNKTDFKLKTVTRERSLYSKRSIYQEDIKIVNIYIPNTKALTYIKQIRVNIIQASKRKIILPYGCTARTLC